jgi:hypothetical protein
VIMHTKIVEHVIQMPRGWEFPAYNITLMSKHRVPPPSDRMGIYPRPSTCICGSIKFPNHIVRNGLRCFGPLELGSEPSASSAASPAASISVILSADCIPNRASCARSATIREIARTDRMRNARARASSEMSTPRRCSSRTCCRAPSIWPVRRTTRRWERRIAACSKSARATPELVPIKSSVSPTKANQFVTWPRVVLSLLLLVMILIKDAWTPAMNAP